MIRNNIFSKFLLLLILLAGWGGSVWGQRFMPTFAATEAEATTWHYIFFPNNGGDRMYANTNNNQLNWISSQTTPTDHFRWYLIGSSSDFILKTVSGLYAYTTNTGTGTDVQYQVTTDASKATHFDLRNGNNSNTWAIHRKSGGDKNSLNHRNNYGIMEWSVDNGSSFIFSNPKEVIKYSAEPVNGQWDANTQWFSMRNNRSNQGTNNRKYITTSAGGVNDQYDIMPTLATMPNDRGSYWCFVGDASGFVIQNAAYGPDFVLAISGNQSNATVKMFRKDEVPNGYTYRFTAVDNKVFDDGTYAYAFRLGTTGNTHIHVTQGHFIIYTHTAIYGDDTGSAFKLTLADASAFNALTAYDVYKVRWEGVIDDFSIDYATSSKTFGKRSKANQDAYMILESGSSVEKEDFTISNSTYGIDKTEVTPAAGYFYKNLVLTLRDKRATEAWTVKISKAEADPFEYAVTCKGRSYKDGETFYLRPEVAATPIDFTINAPDNKFVWGPLVDNTAKTVTYEVRERMEDNLPTGWYQLQLIKSDSEISTLAGKIKENEGNVNTSSNTLYLAPGIYDVGSQKYFKITGVPRYADESATFVYITRNNATSYTLTNPRTGETLTGAFTFENGRLQKSSAWSIENNAHPLEGPYVLLSGNYNFTFNVTPANLEKYRVYKVNIIGNGAETARVIFNNSSVLGNRTVGNGGYLFMAPGSSMPLRSQCSISGGTAVINDVMEGETVDGVTNINITLATRQSYWRVLITGAAKRESDRVVYNNIQYVDDALVGIPFGTMPTALDFKTNVTDRFVWGPIIDKTLQTVTFEVRNTATSLTAGKWYQMVLREKAGQVFDGSKRDVSSMVDAVNSMNTLRQKSNYIYPITAGVTDWTVELTGLTGSEMEAQTYVYISKVSESGVTMMMQNGRYVVNTGQGTNNSNENLPLVYQSANKTFKWNYNAIPWNNLRNGKVGIGNTGAASYGNMEFFMTQAPVQAYKVAIAGNVGTLVYKGDAEIIGSKRANNGSFIFVKEGQSLETDVNKYDLRGVDATITGITTTTTGGITTLNVQIETPSYNREIIHRQAYYYDDIETDSNKPGYGFIKQGEGMNTRKGEGGVIIKEQNMAKYEIPVYLKQGTTASSYLPTNEVKHYQRWYNYDTDGLVDGSVLTSLASWNVSAANTYTNGHLTGDGYGGFRGTPQFSLPAGVTKYNVGLDISRFATRGTVGSGDTQSLIEPTLAMRIVYQVRDAKLIAKAIKDSTTANRFYEVHNISMPNIKHGTYEDKTLSSLVPLDMDLNNYWIFDGNGETNSDLLQLTGDGMLRVELESFSDGAQLKNVMMIPGSASMASGNIVRSSFNMGHFVIFQYPDGGVVPVNSTATINVYIRKQAGAKEYKMAQFNITFIGNSEPLPVTELPGTSRHPDVLKEAFGAPVADLTFDNVRNNEYTDLYRYPLNYKGVNYAYGARNGRNWFAARGEYGVTNMSGTSGGLNYSFYPVRNYFNAMSDVNSVFGPKDVDAYHLYIDAADQPGKIATVELEDALCAGSRMYCYGYIGCTSGGTQYYGNTNQNPSSVIINVIGHHKDTDEEVLVYSYCPGVITLRGYDRNGKTVYAAAGGRGTAYDPHDGDGNYWATWQQIGFSFAIGADIAAEMKSYSIQIVNNSYNSTGADTVLDDFEIYVKKPGAEVSNTTPLCSDRIRHIKVITEYQTLLEAAGEDSNHDGLMNVGFCFLDKEVYDKVLLENADKDEEHGYPRTSPDNKYNKAFGEALMGTRTLDHEIVDHAFHNFNIIRDGEVSTIDGVTKKRYYTDIPQYSFKESGDDAVYRDSILSERYIVFKESVAHDEHSSASHKWTAGKSYYLLFSTATISEEHVLNRDLGCTVFGLDDNRCAVLYEFTVAPPVGIKGDVEEILSGDEVQACAGQTATLTVNLNGRTDTEDVIIKNLNYDWWMSAPTHEVFEMQNGVPKRDAEGNRIPVLDEHGNIQIMEYNTVPATLQNYMNVTWGTYSKDHAHLDKKKGEPIYLCDALLEFRRAYPEARDLVGVVPVHKIGDTVEYDLTQDLIDCVAHFLEPDENGYPPLLLMKKEMNLTLGIDYADKDKVVNFVVIPIAPSIYSVNEDTIYCPDPQELRVRLLNEAPSLLNGFDNMTYPDVLKNIPLRIGRQQIENVRQRQDGVQRTLSIPLRKASFAYAEGTRLVKALDTTVYIVGSDDPQFKQRGYVVDDVANGRIKPSDEDIDDMFIAAGEVVDLSVKRGQANPTMQIVFRNGVTMREGYTYTLKVKYYEVKDDGERDKACDGSFVFDMKVVPEYQVWTAATDNSDWTNDSNWERADRKELHAGTAATGNSIAGATALTDNASYASNEANATSRSFVPMYFTNVLFGRDTVRTAELYKDVDYVEPIMGHNFLQGLRATATRDIQYDMEVTPLNPADKAAFNYDCNYGCELFGTYKAHGVTFAPNTLLLHAEHLDYDKAWVEYELDADRWYTLASPLQNTFAGEWYAPTGTSAGNTSKQLTPHFYDINYKENLNDRFAPAIYQRSWDKQSVNPVYEKNGNEFNAYVDNDWSYVYNDVKTEYSLGGFSVKVSTQYLDNAPSDGKAIVRMPKADTKYTYFDINGDTGQHPDDAIAVNENRSRLWSDKLKEGDTFTQAVTNVNEKNNFFLVSNPFMAWMDMDAFFAANTQFEKVYWLTTASNQSTNVRTDDSSEWISTEADGQFAAEKASVAPLQAFFVKAKTVTNTTTVRYTADMQVDVPAYPRRMITLGSANLGDLGGELSEEEPVSDSEEEVLYDLGGRKIPEARRHSVYIGGHRKLIRK